MDPRITVAEVWSTGLDTPDKVSEERTEREARPETGFMPQLDGLRAYAVAAVLVHHLLDASLFPEPPFSTSWGLLGVRLFFVLSGFLITRLLLSGRDAVDAGATMRMQVLKQFYVRRTLRIFPLYYLVLAIAWVFGGPQVLEQLPWLATYTYNFWITALGWFPEHFSHFWSLCVEEQFYLVWPWIIVFAPRPRLVPLTVLMVLMGPLYRSVALVSDFSPMAFYTLTPSSFDALGMGALLALSTRGCNSAIDVERLLRFTALPVAIAGLFLISGSNAPNAILHETMVALIFVWLVAGAARGFGGVGRWLLESRPILYLGKISYGIYVFHLLIPGTAGPAFERLGLPLAPKGVVEFLVYASLAVVAASLSWTFVERPLNQLKRRFGLAKPSALQPTGNP